MLQDIKSKIDEVNVAIKSLQKGKWIPVLAALITGALSGIIAFYVTNQNFENQNKHEAIKMVNEIIIDYYKNEEGGDLNSLVETLSAYQELHKNIKGEEGKPFIESIIETLEKLKGKTGTVCIGQITNTLGIPIDKAEVIFDQKTIKTNENGIYLIALPISKDMNVGINISKDGYEEKNYGTKIEFNKINRIDDSLKMD